MSTAAVLAFPVKPEWRIGPRPSWAQAVIVAERRVDHSDTQTDYFASSTEETVPLAWSRHTRDRFDEMRKAADTFAPTSHLGVGRGVFEVAVVVDFDGPDSAIYARGVNLFRGCGSPWHRDVVTFTTRALAEAYAAACEPPREISFGDVAVRFKYTVREEKIEHREKYSMGRGYYLSSTGTHGSGWTVCKRTDIERVEKEMNHAR